MNSLAPSLYTIFLLSCLSENKGENHKNNEHVSNTSGEQTAQRKSGERSYTAEKVSRGKCEDLGQPDSNCSVCKSQCACTTLFTANIVFSRHSPFSVPEAGDFLLFCSPYLIRLSKYFSRSFGLSFAVL